MLLSHGDGNIRMSDTIDAPGQDSRIERSEATKHVVEHSIVDSIDGVAEFPISYHSVRDNIPLLSAAPANKIEMFGQDDKLLKAKCKLSKAP
jgi:hypothetical protein